MAFSAGPEHNYIFKYKEHIGMKNSVSVIQEAEKKFSENFGRNYSGLIDAYQTKDADYIIVTLGSIAGLCRETADKLRKKGIKAGVLRIRYMRPFPAKEIAESVKYAKAIAVLEKDISFGNEGVVFTNVNSALYTEQVSVLSYNFIGGLGGRNISESDIEHIYAEIQRGTKKVNFMGIEVAE